MKWTITLDYGPMEAELVGEDREEMQESLLEFLEFINDNFDKFAVESFPEVSTGESEIHGSEARDSSPSDYPASKTNPGFGDIPEKTGFETGTISKYFDLDYSGEEPPLLNFDSDVLGETGNSRREKQMRGSLILLTLLREALNKDIIESPRLKDALSLSGIDDTSLYNMYGFNDGEGDRYFKREGSGQNTEIGLTLPGKRAGYDQLSRTIDNLESTNEDE